MVTVVSDGCVGLRRVGRAQLTRRVLVSGLAIDVVMITNQRALTVKATQNGK